MKSESGITILALVVTITIMAIIGLTLVYTGEEVNKSTEDDILKAQLQTIHHVILQEYDKKLTLGADYNYVGDKVTDISAHNLNIGNKLSDENTYYELDSDDFNAIGLKNITSKYLVCYETGEVANITQYTTRTGEILYIK